MTFQTPVKFPNTLKKDLGNWSAKEKIWLNISHFPWPLDKDCRKWVVFFILYSKELQFKVHGHLCKTLNYSSGRTGKLPKLWEHLAEVPH